MAAGLLYFLKFLMLGLLLLLAGLYAFTRYQIYQIEKQFPAIGKFEQIQGSILHYLDVPAGPGADLPPLLFIHGASGNLRDPMLAFRKPLEGRARLIFVDRPGAGYSDALAKDNSKPDAQANALAELLDRLGIDRAIVVGHSWGGAVTAAFALEHPKKTAGLVFLAPATHPWPGGVTYYYDIASMPVIGWFFTEFLALPVGLPRVKSGVACVFAPSPVPERYNDVSGSELVLRPKNFRNNSRDVSGLKENVIRLSKRYGEITAPTVIITGDTDGVVYPGIHSKGLERDINGARFEGIKNVGHKPEFAQTERAIAAIEEVAGFKLASPLAKELVAEIVEYKPQPDC